MSAFKVDTDLTIPIATGGRRISFPIDGDPTAQILEQDYQQGIDDFVPLDLNTPHPDFPTFYLIAETEIQNLGAGLGQWTRRYATLPAARDDYETFAYRFPGLLGAYNPPYNQYWVNDPGDGRDPRTDTVNSRLAYEYFLIGPGQTYTAAGDIPIIPAQQYTLVGNDNVVINYLLAAGVYPDDSTPTKEDYLAMIAAGTELVAEDSRVERWQGNIFQRVTRYVKAK